MPFYYRRRYNPWRRRRWFRRSWPRSTFRRKYRRKPRWVRPSKKLKKIILREFQPPHIRRCSIKGLTSIINFSPLRLGMNATMYMDSITPEHWPGGGSFCVRKFTLESLYETHQRCRNWWTSSNDDMPLCRYLGCSIRCYQCDNVDYILRYDTQLPGTSNKLTYTSTQPNIMMMSKGRIIIPSRKNLRRHKPYKTFFIKPPAQFKTQWYFTVDIYKTMLLLLHCTTCSLNNYFVKPDKLSNNITFNVLNTELIQNRNMGTDNQQSWPYKLTGGTQGQYFYYLNTATVPLDPNETQVQHIVPLANPRYNTPGYAFSDNSNPDVPTEWNQYVNNLPKYWGNVFNTHILQHPEFICISTKSPESFQNACKKKQQTTKWKELEDSGWQNTLTLLTEPIFFKLQYNPETDTGIDNKFYLVKNNDGHGWDPPLDEDIILEGFPLWLGLWGYLDFQKKAKKLTNIDTKTILVFQTKYTYKPFHKPIVIISENYLNGNSPYESKPLPADETTWYPQVQFQLEQLNKILECGPGTPYTQQKSENIQIFTKFYFKWGGSPPKPITVNDPAHQAVYPIPRNQHETTSLQSPATPPESLLYSFDLRHGQFTSTSLRRISEDPTTKSLLASLTDADKRKQLQKVLETLQESENTQTQKETQVLQQLRQLRQQQQQLRQQITTLITI
nr:MAG: ORF1 [TTV-like mini virus]